MDEHSQHTDAIHNLTQDIYQRVIDLGPQLREFVTSAKQYHKSLLSASIAANSFYQGFTKIAHLASETTGSNKLLGKGICDIIAVHKQIENQSNNVLKAISQEFVVPLEDWIENNISQTKTKQKTYIHESKNALELLEKSKSDLTKVRKKSQRSKTSEKYDMKERQILASFEQYQTKLDELRVSGCHDAIRAQRNVFAFIIEKMSSVSKMDLAHHDKAFHLLTARLPIWENLVKQPLSLDVNVTSLLKQLIENGSYDKSLDEHLSHGTKVDKPDVPTPPPVDAGKLLATKRLSHQFSVGTVLTHKGAKKDKESRDTVQAIYSHQAADTTQLSFEGGDVIKTLTNVTSGWQYGENTRTKKSGWFPVTFTEIFKGTVIASNVNSTHTLPAPGPVHSRPSVLPNVNGDHPNCEIQDGLVIPERDYGIPLVDLENKAVSNSNVMSRQDSQSSGFNSMNNSASSLDGSSQEKDEVYLPPPPPPPPPPILEEDMPCGFPPPPPIPATSESFDQAL